ncbi:hypothetical protein [Clostridium formicaceticum]|uniref:Large polyvalent-protein-associated domain-containing protein n=1 Tax=Clostridium formicaceticum TaxID=1497 RepID=A0AAC9RNF7_9CLOT|nr:hypothetical protein [Clostridium formicaceticum]AOY78141.1 hypothetical protein BJL90_21110 [Clostridium formicaceticum]ARE88792.1 hypothetical protein CLFO_31980 [Clostridium formicaceticum]
MRLQELAKELQADLEAGIVNFIIYQEGRQWKYIRYDSCSNDVNEEEEKKYMLIKNRVDDQAVIVNGKRDFTSYDLKDIQQQIKNLHG